ncbi:AMP-binding protein [Shewanella algae]|uniref:AMP-binding protein n=1 Tax=Shewanella algae TaxID=38313 RepID=UPI0012DEE0CF|nr:AMP-binding protein [Shewanella algae]
MTYSPLHLSGQQTPDAIALVEGGISHSYQAVSRQVLALGAELRALGLQRGDKLACVAANCRELMLLYWACLDLGLLFCPLSPKFPDSQLQELLERFHIRFIWCPDNTRNKLWQMRDIHPSAGGFCHSRIECYPCRDSHCLGRYAAQYHSYLGLQWQSQGRSPLP